MKEPGYDDANNQFEDDDNEAFASGHQERIGEKLRKRNHRNDIGSSGGAPKTILNELIGYGAGLLFIALAAILFFEIYKVPGMSAEQRVVFSLILSLYGLYRAVTTRGKANAAKRRAKIMKHRSHLGSDTDPY